MAILSELVEGSLSNPLLMSLSNQELIEIDSAVVLF